MTNYLARAMAPTPGKDNSQHFGDIERTGGITCISMLGTLVPVMAGTASMSSSRARVTATQPSTAPRRRHEPPGDVRPFRPSPRSAYAS